MIYNESAAIVYRIVRAYPFFTKHLTDAQLKDMVEEWHENLKNIPSDRAMEAVTQLIGEQKWLPSLSEVISKILDLQFGTEEQIIRAIDRAVSASSRYIIFGQVTEEQERGYEKLTPLQKMIVKSPYEFNAWLMKDYEWKEERVKRVKRELQHGGSEKLNRIESKSIVDIFQLLDERKGILEGAKE